MGQDKECLKYNGIYLMDTIIYKLKKSFDEIVIVTNNPAIYNDKKRQILKDVLITTDIIKDKGPCVGLYSGLAISSNEDNFLLACDMPYINNDYIKYLLDMSYKNALVYKNNKYFEPFCAMYKKDLLYRLKEFIYEDQRSLNKFLRTIEPDIIDDSIIESFDKEKKMFTNINYPEEWQAFIGEYYEND